MKTNSSLHATSLLWPNKYFQSQYVYCCCCSPLLYCRVAVWAATQHIIIDGASSTDQTVCEQIQHRDLEIERSRWQIGSAAAVCCCLLGKVCQHYNSRNHCKFWSCSPVYSFWKEQAINLKPFVMIVHCICREGTETALLTVPGVTTLYLVETTANQ